MPRSNSPTSRTPTGRNSIPNCDVADWIAPNCPLPDAVLTSRSAATRITPGAICLSNSTQCPPSAYSNKRKPVVFPPGRARLSTRPALTGSTMLTKTIGTVRVVCCAAATATVPLATITSGASAANSAAYLRTLSASPAPQRWSIRKLRPTVQPNSCKPCANAARRVGSCGSSAPVDRRTPTRRTRSACCARAASGHAATEPAITWMKSRRLMQPPPGLTTRLILFKVQPSRHAVGPSKSSVTKSLVHLIAALAPTLVAFDAQHVELCLRCRQRWGTCAALEGASTQNPLSKLLCDARLLTEFWLDTRSGS